MRRSREQRGQAIVMFALMATVIVGGLVLVADTGMMYVARRNLQNIADNTALVGAQFLPASETDVQSAAMPYATKNGINTSGGDSIIIKTPPITGNHVGNPKFVEVQVTRSVPSFFSGVWGQGPATINARAVAWRTTQAGDWGIIGLSTNCNPAPVQIAGVSNTNVVNGGIHSNGGLSIGGTASVNVGGPIQASSIQMPPAPGCAATVSNNVTVNVQPTSGNVPISDPIQVRIDNGEIIPPTSTQIAAMTDYGNWSPGPAYADPNFSGWHIAQPGRYNKITIGNNDKVKFSPGLYVIDQSVSISGDTADTFAIGVQSASEDVDAWDSSWWTTPDSTARWGSVTFYFPDQDNSSTFSATGGTVRFAAGSAHPNYEMVVWSYGTNNTTVQITGGSNASLLGSVYAPKGGVSLTGNSYAPLVRGRVIGDTISITGGAYSVVNYDPGLDGDESAARLAE